MKKLLIAIAGAAAAISTYAGFGIGGAAFEEDAAAPQTWTKAGGFDGGFWLNTADTMTRVEADCGFDPTNRPSGLGCYGLDTQYSMNVKTTFGSPVTQRVITGGEPQMIGNGFYYDGLVKFTACDETPDLTAAAYDGAKIGFFPLLESDEDNAKAYLCIWAAGNATNLWKTTTEIDDAWHRVTIKMIANANKTGTAQPAFVVFIDGNVATCTAAKGVFTEANLTPAAKKWWRDGALFASLTSSTEVTGVLYDGQGAIDEVGFADVAPFADAEDDKYMTVSAGEYITEFTVGDQTWTTGAAPLDVLITGKDSIEITGIKCTTGHFVDPDSVTIAAADFADAISVADKVTVKTANFSVGTDKCETWAEAVAAAVGSDVTIKLEGEDYEMTDDDLLASINNVGEVTTIDFNGKTITGCINATTDVAFVNEGDEGGIIGVDIDESGLLTAVSGGAAVAISGGQFDGWVFPTTSGSITGGKFLEQLEQTDFYLTGYVVSGYKEELDTETGYWTVKEVEVIMVPVTLTATYATASMKDGEENPVVEGDVAAGTTIFVTATADTNYDTPVITVNGAPYDSVNGYTIAEDDAAVAFVVTASATEWTITYIDNGDEVGTDTYTVENRSEKTLLVLAEKPGFTFDGWYENSVKVESLAGKTGALTLTAEWTQDLINLEDAVITLSAEKVVEGDTLPTVTSVTLNSQPLTVDQDYTVTPPTEVGAAGTVLTWIITGKGAYTGTASTNLTVEAKAVEPVEPGKDITTDKTLAEINSDPTLKAQLLKAPEGATVDPAVYNTYFDAVSGATPGTVKFVLNATGEATIQANANSEIVKIKPDEIAALTTESGEFEVATTIPGFYYAVKQGNGIGTMKVVEAGKLATDDKGIELMFEKYSGAGFYQIVVSEKPIPAEN